MNEKILVTGGTGLLGSYLIRLLLDQGYQNITATYAHSSDGIPESIRQGVDWKKMELPDLETVDAAVIQQDWVIHTAGMVSYHPADKYKLLDINRTGTEQIVNACLAHGIQHLIYVGSIGALGREFNPETLRESSPWIDSKYATAYGLSKYLGELEAWRGAAEGLPVSVILPSIILGSGDWTRSSLQIMDRVAHGSAWHPGGQTGLVDVRDVATFILFLLQRSSTGERWLLSATDITYAELYKKIAHHLGVNRSFQTAPKWLARLILSGKNLLHRSTLGPDMLHQVYGTFSFDASKSLTVEGFRYRDPETTLKEVAQTYLAKNSAYFLPW